MNTTSLPSIGQLVQQHKLAAAKKFGQHFLFDANLTEKIVHLANIHASDLVFEVGPGPGGLTRALLATGANIHVIEMDQRFSPILEQLHSHFDQGLHIHMADALKTDMQSIAQDVPYHVVANLPYNVGTKLLINWLTQSPIGWKSLTLMFQLEVAQRITATVGSKQYGRLSILTAATANAHKIMNVPASAFSPPPKVESAVVHIVPLPPEQRFSDLEKLARITGLAFGQRRKMLRASLKSLSGEIGADISDWLSKYDIDPKARPETLHPSEFMKLAERLPKQEPAP